MSEKKIMPDERLDQLLSEMADETPDMPADFHARWTQAVRAEAAKAATATEPAAETVGMPEAEQTGEKETKVSAAGRPERKIRRLPAAWSRLIGAAAVMVFLIGGTLLTRDSFHPQAMQTTSRNEQARIETTLAAQEEPAEASVLSGGTDAGEAPAMGALSAKSAADGALSTAMPTLMPEMKMSAENTAEEIFDEYAAEEAAAEYTAEEAAAAEASGALMMAALQPDEAEEAAEAEEIMPDMVEVRQDSMTAADHSRNDAAEAVEEPEAEEDESELLMVSNSFDAGSGDEMPEESGQEEEAAAAPSDVDEAAEHPVISFLKDMLLFIRWIAPWALVLGIGVLAGWIVGKRKKQ